MRFKIYLTRREQTVLAVVAALLVLGGIVKYYRASHPAPSTIQIK
jgi:hypothetical protein